MLQVCDHAQVEGRGGEKDQCESFVNNYKFPIVEYSDHGQTEARNEAHIKQPVICLIPNYSMKA